MSAFADLKDKVAVVTGGASGIGKAIAAQLIAEGGKVVIADIEEGALAAAAAEIGAVGIRTDVGDLASVQALARATVERFGTVHIVCNNAGVAPKAMIQNTTMDDWRWLIDVNLWGVIHGVQLFLPILLANADGGHVVNVASAGGFVTGPMIGPYSVTKAGVVALSEALAAELALQKAKVGVTVFCPGTVRTNLHTGSRNRPASRGDIGAVDIDLMGNPLVGQSRWLKPEEAAPFAIAAIRRGELYATSHPETAELVAARTARVVTAFRNAAT